MKDLLVCIYMVKIKNGYRAFMTHNPLIDACVISEDEPSASLDLLTPFLPVGIADYVLKTVFTKEEILGQAINKESPAKSLLSWITKTTSYDDLVSFKAKNAAKLLKQIEYVIGAGTLLPGENMSPRKLLVKDLPAGNADIQEMHGEEAVREALRGKILFLEEVEKSLRENGFETGPDPLDILQVLALKGEIEILPSLGFTAPAEVTCFRCGHKIRLKQFFTWQTAVSDSILRAWCPRCRFPSLYCERCNTLGESRLCRGLFALGDRQTPKPQKAGAKLSRGGASPLTPAQNRASRELVDFINSGKETDCLLWAVTGAGKTEVVFPAITAVLEAGGRILYAIPRRDVVKELAPRLQSSFWGIDVMTSYGGSPEKFRSVPVVIATTHQVLRYYKQFDLVVLDEVDAYPYKENEMLRLAVKRATKPGGHTIYLTATPDKKIISGVNRGLIKLVTIPARHHGYPVPEPQFKRLVSFQKLNDSRWTVDPFILELLNKWLMENDRQVLIFLPTVQMVDTYGPVLEKAIREWSGSGEPGVLRFSHARDSLRDQKREDFKAGKFRLFLTTTIMERGITVKKANVLVLEADFEQVFDESTLIQIAGRAGRSKEFPDGEVVFVGRQINRAMKNARKKINYLNTVARSKGYLNCGE